MNLVENCERSKRKITKNKKIQEIERKK